MRLRVGSQSSNAENCNISEKGVDQITWMKKLEELVLGNQPDYSDEPAAKNREEYEHIFKTMKNLRELDMREPTLSEINICTH